MTTPKTSYTPTITKEQLPSLADVDHVFSWTPTTIEIAKLNTHMRERVDAYVCDYAPGLAVAMREITGTASVRYSVTHLASGFGIGTCYRTYAGARAVVIALANLTRAGIAPPWTETDRSTLTTNRTLSGLVFEIRRLVYDAEDRGEYGAACTLTTDLRDARKHERDLTLRDWDRWNGFPPTGDEQHEQQNNTRPRGKRP